MLQRKTRSIVVALSAIAAFVATFLGISTALESAGIESGSVGIGFGMILSARTDSLAASGRLPYERVIVLGDSTVIDYPHGRSVPDDLRRMLRQRASRTIEVIPLAEPGMSALEYYAFADRIARTHPDQIVVPINLASFSAKWRREFDRVEAFGWIDPGRLEDLLTRPFHAWGLTLDRVLLYMGVVELGLPARWRALGRAQVRALHGLSRLRRSLLAENPRTLDDGLPFFRLPFHTEIDQRPNRLHVESLYGDALDGLEVDHPVVQMLAGALEVFEHSGIRTLAYVIPMNVEHFERIGFDTRSGMGKTIDTLRSVVESRGGRLVDLHDLLPDRGFKDLGGHFLQADAFDGALEVARQLVPELLRNSPRQRPGPGGRGR